eukprot:m.21147 g.21147  ORF g.21147 m.21147 type:complete len:729 (-) comp8244_c0_seq2:534-2720(-)
MYCAPHMALRARTVAMQQMVRRYVAMPAAFRGQHVQASKLAVTMRLYDQTRFGNVSGGVPSVPRAQLHSSTVALGSDGQENSSKRQIFVDIVAKESKVEQKVKQLLTQQMKEMKNPSYTFLIDKRALDEIKETKPELPLTQRLLTFDFWWGGFKSLFKSETYVKLWEAVKHEARHYRDGFKLLATDIKVSSRLLKKLVGANSLTRRERNQLVRTTGDLLRLIPFSAFIIVPGLEFFLPIVVKVFPGFLPSQFQSAQSSDSLKAQLKVRLEMAKLLQDTIEDMAVKRKGSEAKDGIYAEFSAFLAASRDGRSVPTKDILKFAPMFKNEMTLDTLDRPQLAALCKILHMEPIGPSGLLRLRLQMKLNSLSRDDKLIASEGVSSLSPTELQNACRERGMRALGVSVQTMRHRLQQWLDLHLEHGIPSTLLLLSRIIYLPEKLPPTERLRAVLEGLPESLVSQVRAEILEVDGERVDSTLRLEILAAEEQRIREEQEELGISSDQSLPTSDAEVPPTQTPTPAVEAEPFVATTLADVQPSGDVDAITIDDLLDLAVVLSDLSGQQQLAPELETLREDIAEYKEDVAELEQFSEGKLAESGVSTRIVARVDKMMAKLQQSIDEVDKAQHAQLDLDRDGVISRDELMVALQRMRHAPSERKAAAICDLLDADGDGKLCLDTLQTVCLCAWASNLPLSGLMIPHDVPYRFFLEKNFKQIFGCQDMHAFNVWHVYE